MSITAAPKPNKKEKVGKSFPTRDRAYDFHFCAITLPELLLMDRQNVELRDVTLGLIFRMKSGKLIPERMKV